MEDVPKPNLVYRPPIILQPADEGLAVLQSFIDRSSDMSLSDVATGEAARLGYYLDTLDQRLSRPLNIITNHPVAERAAPRSLRDAFTMVARDSGNVILSEFGAMPRSVFQKMKPGETNAQELTIYFKENLCDDAFLSLGFFQVARRDKTSVSTSMLVLDDEILELIPPDVSPSLAQGLCRVLSAGNHDVMHHLTNAALISDIAKKAQVTDYAHNIHVLIDESTTLRNSKGPKSYESWAILSHTSNWREIRRAGEDNDLSRDIDRFHDLLQTTDQTLLDRGIDKDTRHRIISYFSTACTFGLMRILPFNDPLMQHALQRAEDADPDPLKTLTTYMARRGVLHSDVTQNLENQLYTICRDIAVQPETIGAKRILDGYRALSEASPEAWKDDRCSALSQYYDLRNKTKINLGNDVTKKASSALAHIFSPENHTQDNAGNIQTFAYQLFFDRAQSDESFRVQHADFIHALVNDYIRSSNDMVGRGLEKAQSNRENIGPVASLENYFQAAENKSAVVSDSPWQNLRQRQVIEMAPEIAYLLSPDDNDPALAEYRRNARKIDTAVANILRHATTQP